MTISGRNWNPASHRMWTRRCGMPHHRRSRRWYLARHHWIPTGAFRRAPCIRTAIRRYLDRCSTRWKDSIPDHKGYRTALIHWRRNGQIVNDQGTAKNGVGRQGSAKDAMLVFSRKKKKGKRAIPHRNNNSLNRKRFRRLW